MAPLKYLQAKLSIKQIPLMRYTAVLRLMIMFFCRQATFCVCSSDAYQKAASAAGVKSIKVESLVSY